nr:type I restriction-modification system subunit M [Pelovirga terrestris]
MWKSCDELRGGMDASQYKDYILTLLFVKYVSDKYAGNRNALILVPEGGSFADMVKLVGNKEIGDRINKIISRLAEENDLKGVIDVADFNNEDQLGKGQEMVDRLSRLVKIFDGMDLRANRAEGDDLLGDAYEYLMRNFATESGKSKGQFYTPAEVSRIMAKIIGINRTTSQDHTVYDPTCGSGSLLLKASDEAPRGMSIFGQEMDNATAALARMNMILHDCPTAEIWKDNTLSVPHFKERDGSLKMFDYAVANPPFSTKAWSNGFNPNDDQYRRFEYGVPPDKNGDYAFLLHLIKSLKSTGKGAIILPHGVLFRGNAEAVIRKNLVRRGLIKGIISLPANLFYGTGIPACILVIDKEQAQGRDRIFMIDAGKGFMKDGNKNRLRSQDIHKIVDVFNKQLELPRYSRMIPLEEIAANDYNLNIPRYIDSGEAEDLHDLDAHLNGGIPNADIAALERYWRVLPSLRHTLFAPARDGYSNATVAPHEVKNTILQHPEFTAFAEGVQTIFDDWQAAHRANLNNLVIGDEPKQVIVDLSEDLLERFAKAELLDKYDVYQHLMDYWAEQMQDDVFVLVQDGWVKSAQLRQMIDSKKEKSKEAPDLVVGKARYKTDLIPPQLIVARYFAAEQQAITDREAVRDDISRELDELIEEHSGEEGLLEEAKTDKGKVTKASLKARMAEARTLADNAEEMALLTQCSKLIDRLTAAEKQVKDAQQALDEKVLAKYPKLTEAEIKNLVVEDKWFATVEAAIRGEVDRVTQTLAGRVKALEERYAEPLPALTNDVVELSARVDAHLQKMGLVWK